MIDELKDVFVRVATTPHNLYGHFWEQSPFNMTAYHKVCPMYICPDVIQLLKWECAHLGVSIASSHIEVQTIGWVALCVIVLLFILTIEYRGLAWGYSLLTLLRRGNLLAKYGDVMQSCQLMRSNGPKMMIPSFSTAGTESQNSINCSNQLYIQNHHHLQLSRCLLLLYFPSEFLGLILFDDGSFIFVQL
jgi:hypothetical protein